jgi:CheY-like chemotaxis protein
MPTNSRLQKPPVVLIVNTSPDVIEMLRLAFEHSAIVVVSTFTHLLRSGEVDIEALVRQHAPGAVIYDIAPPYANNWLLFQHIANLPALAGLPLVVTTTNKAHVGKLAAAANLPIFEIVGLPYDINALVDGVQQAMGINQPAS